MKDQRNGRQQDVASINQTKVLLNALAHSWVILLCSWASKVVLQRHHQHRNQQMDQQVSLIFGLFVAFTNNSYHDVNFRNI